MEKRAGVGVGFAIASACGLVVGVLVPQLLPFAVLGVALGLLPVLLHWAREEDHWWGRSGPTERRTAIGILGALAGVAATIAGLISIGLGGLQLVGGDDEAVGPARKALPSGGIGLGEAVEESGETDAGGVPEPRRLMVVRAAYTGRAVHRGDPERLEVTDRLRISRPGLRRTPGRLRDLTRGLAAQRWIRGEGLYGGVVFKRHREVPLNAPTLALETGNTVDLPTRTVAHVHGTTMRVRIGEGSKLILVADPDTFGDSVPPGDRRTWSAKDLEELSVPVRYETEVEIDVRSPLFRNELMSGLAGVTLSGAARWAIGFLGTALIALFNEELKARLKRALRRLRPRLGSAPG